MNEQSLQQLLNVRGRFHRSVNVEKDWNNASSLNDYLATPTALELARRIVVSLDDPSASRAWSITGPFGSGKSAFGVFLIDALCRLQPAHHDASRLRQSVGLTNRRLLPVVAVGRRSRLIPAFLEGLGRCIAPYDNELATRVRTSGTNDAAAVWQLVNQVTTAALNSGFDGLFVVLDELGKFMEHAALHPTEDDIFVLQSLAEGAARSPGRMLLITMQHSAFADYARSASSIQTVEWQKIQGRFTDVAFYLPSEQMLSLLGASLEPRWPGPLEAAYHLMLSEALQNPAFNEARNRTPINALLPRCLPLDPICALLLWPLFRAKMAQNERSLFAFLTSQEPRGFQEFLRTATWMGGIPPLYRVDQLYDYVTTAVGSSVLLGEKARRWAEAEQALDRISADAPPYAHQVIKAIALIGLYGPLVGLKPSVQTLALALGNDAETEKAIDYLLGHSHIVYRRHRDDYGIWEGSDVDLDACFDDAVQRLAGGSIAERLERIARPQPRVARAHYIATGTLRHFDVRLVDGSPERLPREYRRLVAESKGDGAITFILAPRTESRAALLERVRELTSSQDVSQLQIAAVPKAIVGLEDAALDLEAWLWVQSNEPGLASDWVAREEVRARVTSARERLDELVGRIFGLPGFPFEPERSEWIAEGETQLPRSARAFTQWLSTLCDRTYNQAPTLRNELLNREQLSSAAAKARRNLLEAMIHREGEPRLGFTGSPPEATMYDSMLLKGGFHAFREGKWSFGPPKSNWLGVWQAFEHSLQESTSRPIPFTRLVDRLQAPPFGLRSGPIPVLLIAALLAKRDEVALYEQGTFLPELRIEAIERLLRKPEEFSLRLFKQSKLTQDVLSSLGSIMLAPTGDQEGKRDQLISVVKSLILFVAKLTPYASTTRRFDDPSVVSVRQCLLHATDPYALIFDELPNSLGIRIDYPNGAEELTLQLRVAIQALERAYPSLLQQVEEDICQSLGLGWAGPEAADALRMRAEPLRTFSADRRLTTFIREATRQTSDWRESLARVVMDGRPPSHWKDVDLVAFRTRLQLLAQEFIRLEELSHEHRHEGGTVLRVDVLNGHYNETRALLTVPPSMEESVRELDERIATALANAGAAGARPELRLAALARAMAREADAQAKGTI